MSGRSSLGMGARTATRRRVVSAAGWSGSTPPPPGDRVQPPRPDRNRQRNRQRRAAPGGPVASGDTDPVAPSTVVRSGDPEIPSLGDLLSPSREKDDAAPPTANRIRLVCGATEIHSPTRSDQPADAKGRERVRRAPRGVRQRPEANRTDTPARSTHPAVAVPALSSNPTANRRRPVPPMSVTPGDVPIDPDARPMSAGSSDRGNEQ